MTRVPLRASALFALVAVLSLAGCKSSDNGVAPPPPPPAPTSACEAGSANGVQNHNTPLICVSGTTSVTVDPPSIHVWDVNSTDRRTPPTIVWLASGTGGSHTLKVSFKDSGCASTPSCSGPKCTAKVLAGLGASAAPGMELKRCRYSVTLDNLVLDPDTVIVRCCSDTVADPQP